MTIFHGQCDNDDEAYEFSFDDDTDCDGCHHSHKSGEQCEWAAGLYHLQPCQPDHSMDTTLPGQITVWTQPKVWLLPTYNTYQAKP